MCSPTNPTRRRMDSDIYDALLRYVQQEFAGWKPDNEATHYSRYNIGGLDFAKWTTGERDSVIFFPTLPDNRPVPARIRDIISLTRNGQELVFLAVHRFKPVRRLIIRLYGIGISGRVFDLLNTQRRWKSCQRRRV
jgi:hypothetical protein